MTNAVLSRHSYWEDTLSHICKEFPFQEKIWITNRYIAAKRFLQSMTLRGHSWLNVRVISPSALAQSILQSYRPEYRCLSYDNQCFVIEDLLREAQLAQKLSYLGHLDQSKSLGRLLINGFTFLRASQKGITDLDPNLFFQPEKGQDIQLLGQLYQTFLDEHKLYDQNTCYALAEEALQKQLHWDRPTCLFYDDEETLALSAQSLIKTFASNSLRGMRMPQVNWSVSSNTHFSLSYSPWCEVRDCLEALVAKNISWDQVEMVVPDMHLYGPLVMHVTQSKGIPVTYEEGEYLSQSRLLQLLKGVVELCVQDWDQAIVLRLYRDGLLPLPESLCESAFEEYLAALKVGWGLKRWKHYLDAPTTVLTKEGVFLKQFIQSVITLVEPLTEKPLTLQTLTERIRVFLKESMLSSSERDVHDFDELARKLSAMAAIDVKRNRLYQTLKDVILLLDKMRVNKSGPKPGAIHVRSAKTHVYEERPYLIILGLNDLWIPGQPAIDPLLIPQERARILGHETLPHDDSEQIIRQMKHLIGMHQGPLWLSCVKVVPLQTNYGLMPSPVILWAYRQAHSDETISYESMLRAVDDQSAYASANRTFALWTWEELSDSQIFAPKSLQAFEARQSDQITEFDGKPVISQNILTVVNRENHSVSATSLQTMASCPFRYYVYYVLQLKERKVRQRDMSQWLDVADWGSMVHAALFDMMHVWMNNPEMEVSLFKQLGFEIARHYLQEYSQRYGVANVKAYANQERLFYKVVDNFAEHEVLRQGRKAAYLEIAFGRSKVQQQGSLQHVDPVPFRLGQGRFIYLSGSIDRVDRCSDDSYVILDYKTSASGWLKPDDRFCQGRHLQPFLYAYVLDNILEEYVKVKATGYFYATPKGRFQEHVYADIDFKELKGVVGLLVQAIEQGTFVVMKGLRGTSGPCMTCSGRWACQVYRDDEADKKFANNQDEQLVALQELQGMK